MAGERPRFSEILADRRSRLGLSLSQASQVLRLKEQVLLAFEEGNFEQMPKSGYAQGMLSSYARYLGLNPKQITDQYAADLDDYLRSGRGREFFESSAMPANGVSSPVPRYQGARGLLPTSGGLAGDYGAFATTSAVRRSSGSSSATAVPDADRTTSVSYERVGGYGGSYGSDYGSTYGRVPDAARASMAYQEDYGSSAQRRYTTRNPGSGPRGRTSRSDARMSRRRGSSQSRSVARTPDRYAGRDQVTTRRVGSGQYVDDLRYGDISPFEAASTTSGRRDSRDIASTRRPNVRRQQSTRSAGRPQRGGAMGVIEAFFSDPRRAALAIVIIAVLVLTVFLVTSVRSCIANQSSTGRTVEVTKAQASSKSSEESEADADAAAADEQALADAAASKPQQTIPAETIVVVSVVDVSWVHIDLDGTSVIAESVTGPWEQTYTVKDVITIEVGNTNNVTVTENGTQRQFDSRAGIGTITIRNAVKAAAEASGADATAGDAGQGASGSSDATTATDDESGSYGDYDQSGQSGYTSYGEGSGYDSDSGSSYGYD